VRRLLAIPLLLAPLVLVACEHDYIPPECDPATDAYEQRELGRAQAVVDWANGVPLYIGEIGWHANDARAQTLANKVYCTYNRANASITYWSTSTDNWWCDPNGDGFSAYCRPAVHPQAQVIEAWPLRWNVWRGVNLLGSEFGACPGACGVGSGGSFSNANPGTYGSSYIYPASSDLDFLKGRGITTVRVPVRWERIQPALGGPLESAELARMVSTATLARDRGMTVIFTLMNYGAYWTSGGVRNPIGGPVATIAHFADVWGRLSSSITSPAVSWALMNEPAGMPGEQATWEQAAQAAIDAIRSTGDSRRVWVATYNWSSAMHVPSRHPNGPWITGHSNFGYEVHHYFEG
jgi:aryl-phospho-beta-D-glucosidase BglC (GH1 family)